MPGPTQPIMSSKDGMQVLRAAFDDTTGRLKTDAQFTGTLEVNLDAANDSVAIGDSDGDNTLAINDDGSINTAIVGTLALDISAADGDNISISDGTNTLEVNADGSINVAALPVYATRLDEASETITYIGKATAGTPPAAADWQISRMTVSGTLTTIEYADGSADYDQVWDDRAGLSYS